MIRFCKDHLNPVDNWVRSHQVIPKQHAEESVEFQPRTKPYDWQNELDLTSEPSTVVRALCSIALDPRSEIIASLQEGVAPESNN